MAECSKTIREESSVKIYITLIPNVVLVRNRDETDRTIALSF